MLEDSKRKLIEKDIIFAECGYVYCPEKSQGFLNEYLLREIADILEEKNKPFNEELEEYFNNEQ